MTDIAIPSDNFHKFITFAGLAIFLTAVALPGKMIVDLVNRMNDFNVQLGEHEAAVKWHTERAAASATQRSSITMADVPLEIAAANGRIFATRKAIVDLQSMETKLIYGAVAAASIGVLIGGYGVKRWAAHQAKLDTILELQLAEHDRTHRRQSQSRYPRRRP